MYSAQFQFQMMFMWCNSNASGVTGGAALLLTLMESGRRSCDPIAAGITHTYATGAYHHKTLLVRIPFKRGVLDTT